MKIGVEVSHSMNLGNYESVKPSVTVEDDVAPGESAEKAFQRVTSIAHQLWAKEFKTSLSEHDAARKVIQRKKEAEEEESYE